MSFNRIWFALNWLFVIAVSVNDGYWVLANRLLMPVTEQNPLGRWLISAWGGDIGLLLLLKAIGTLSAASILLLFYSFRPRLAGFVCAAVAAIQLALLLYLYAV